MKASSRVIVLKFGGSVLHGPAGCRVAVHEIYRYVREGYRVVAVTSAFRGQTDALFSQASELSSDPCAEGTAALVRTGELQSAAALVIACDGAGLPASLIEPQQAGLSVSGHALDADPVSVDADVIHAELASTPVVVVPGYFGYGNDGKPRLLGRGGTDLSALILAKALGASCRLLKDVDAWYDSGNPLRSLHLDEAARRDDPVVQPKAATYAASNRVPYTVGRAGTCDDSGTLVGLESTEHTSWHVQPPLRVAIAGVGTVGSGVWYHLEQASTDFDVVGGLVRNVDAARDTWVRKDLLVNVAADLPQHELLVEALPTADAAYLLVRSSLQRGVSVVTANKALIATHGAELLRIASESRATLRYAATVGGGCPAIEFASAVNAEAPVVRLRAVLNATSNFVLDEVGAGNSLDVAVRDAQERGFAEADPSSDLSGLDAAYKLVILAHALTGQWIDATLIPRDDIRDVLAVDERDVHDPQRPTGGFAEKSATPITRQVATLSLAADQANGPYAISDASVRLEALDQTDPLNRVSGNWNAVILETNDGERSVVGRGAGRWPTAESVVADAFEIRRLQSNPIALAEAC